MNLDGLDEVGERAKGMFLPGRLIGVEAENRGIVGAEVWFSRTAIALDIGFQDRPGLVHDRPLRG